MVELYCEVKIGYYPRYAVACWQHGVNSQLLVMADGGHGLNKVGGRAESEGLWAVWQDQALRWMAAIVGEAVKNT